MDAYSPSSPQILVGVLLAALLSLGFGYLLQRQRNQWAGWLYLLATIAITDRALATEPAGFRMLALLALAAYAMKALVAIAAHHAGQAPLGWKSWLAFAGVWLGMQPREFVRAAAPRPAWRLAAVGVAWIGAGALTIHLVQLLHAHLGTEHLPTTGLLFIAGCSMVLHFGCIGLVAAGLRGLGFEVGPQFRAPWRSENLHEFWARRWNVGFSVMTTLVVYRPVAKRLGRPTALVLGFLASGLLHELACSLPVNAGYGGPTVYFALHAGAVAAEHGLRRRGVDLRGWRGRLWMLAWVLLPLPLLFHAPFLRGIVLPLL